FFQAEDGIRDFHVTGVQTCALPISAGRRCAATKRSVSASYTNSRSPVLVSTRMALPPDTASAQTDFASHGPLPCGSAVVTSLPRSEEHTSELQSRENLVCRLLLEKK